MTPERLLGPVLAALGLAAMLAVASAPLAPGGQAAFAVAVAVVFLLVDRRRGRAASLLLVALSAAMSLRYLVWRLADTLDAPAWPLSELLLLVEAGAAAALWLAFARFAWPLRRPPWPLPAQIEDWPAVDLLIPVAHAPMAAMRDTVLAALAIDWPADRLAVWLLDPAARPQCREAAAALGCNYVAGADARPAAAAPGDAPFLAVFRAGDVPMRACLQLTVGWLLARPRLAFVQGEIGARGVCQDGRDTFDAVQFLGSGAVLRRAALRDAGGWSATPARTSHRLRRLGWHAAALALPVAAVRVARRLVWAAGVPWPALAALVAVPVLLLLTSLPRLAVAAYALPHLALALATAARLPGRGRPRPRPASLPITVSLPDGPVLDGVAAELRREGATLRLGDPPAAGVAVQVCMAVGDETLLLPARVIGAHHGMTEIAWTHRTLAEEARIVRAVYGRADASLGRPSRRGRRRSALAAASLALAGLLAAAAAARAQAQVQAPAGSDYSVRPIPGGAADTLPQAEAAPAGARTVVYTLHQLGAAAPLALRGTQPVLGLGFGVRADEVVTAATLNLEGAVSPALLPALSNVTVTLNGQYVATIPADRRTPGFTAEIPITPTLLQSANRLEFRLAGRAQADCDDPLSPLLWATIADSSTLTLTLARLPPQRDLARLPRPFFDADDPAPPVLQFVLPAAPDSEALHAAGVAASWFGQLAGARGAHFTAAADLPASGDAVVIQVAADAGILPGAPPVDGPTLAVLANPHDPFGSVLLVAGRSDAEALVAARALAFGIRAMAGSRAVVQPPEIAARLPYDAPAWIATDRSVRLGALASAAALQGSGYASLLSLPFRTAPDLWTWRDRPFAVDLRWRAPPGPVVDLAASRLDVGLNGDYLASLPLARDGAAASAARIAVPAYDVSGDNALSLYFDARPLRRAACAAIPDDLRMAIDADSTLDLSRAYHLARLPDLRAFVETGFPFTRLADLSQTAIVLPEQPSAVEIAAYLEIMGRLGAATGLPGGEATVVRPGEVAGAADRDLLVLGTLPGLQSAGLAGLLDESPVGFADGRLHVKLGSASPRSSRGRAAAAMSAGFSGGLAVLVGAESPLRSGRSVVALLAADGPALQAAMASLADPQQARQMRGDLALLSGGQVTSYRVGPAYTVGTLPLWLWPSWYLGDQPWAAFAVLLIGCALLALALFWWFARRAAARLPPRPLR